MNDTYYTAIGIDVSDRKSSMYSVKGVNAKTLSGCELLEKTVAARTSVRASFRWILSGDSPI